MLRGIFSRFNPTTVETVKPHEGHLPPMDLRVVLCDPRRDVVDAWIDHFRNVAAVEIVCGSLFNVKCDALVCPANSFEDMSGGLDQAIDNHYEGAAQRAGVQRIREEHLGELPVGAALIVRTEKARLPLIIAAPTMRTPGSVSATINAYLAMRAVLSRRDPWCPTQPTHSALGRARSLYRCGWDAPRPARLPDARR